ncbi:SDR family NAD(P)-dependent oxidoreductase [Nocardia sp. CDC159]|uniref:SDR family NAD(P)-dependent oxidoreductase n=1 Tax=Nocardia pulmonis TaxID=2951408 RepID=A0A9X2E8C4_9NOCA|nr:MULTISPECIES: SDR family NAD(P)-dependent oxidoreductase [Nocardia]MCM6775460.1 SDR family NAD(P)-dependent oxidoreductase [Nocardia pulmonis]MCM6787806.1 SDR family NAD(P)-dependent oxidoreductase [Nocardia sp. CDC159]
MTTFLGADGGRELIAWLTGPAKELAIELRADAAIAARTLRLRRPTRADSDQEHAETTVPEQRLLDRHVLVRAERPLHPTGPAAQPIPADALVLTNSTAALAALPMPPSALAVVTGADDADFDSALAEIRARRPRHIRVIVECTDGRLHTAHWSEPVRALLRLHEFTFLAARAASEWFDAGPGDCSLLVTVLDGIGRPFTGLFTGFVKSLALEMASVPIIATVHDDAAVAAALDLGARELAAEQLLPVVYYERGRRTTPRARRRAATPGGPRLTSNSVVLAAGGARGIGAPLLDALAQRYRCRIVVLGRTALGDNAPEEDRAQFIRRVTGGPDRVSVAEASARFDRLQDARAIQGTLSALESRCGPGRVEYRRCDLRDPDDVRTVVASVLADHGRVDLLLNIAGTNRAAAIATKTRADFRTVRDLKVHTYLNLRDAFGAEPPRRWCNFGSFVGFTGQIGETDYASANDFLYTAAESADGDEFTIGWTLWRDIGLGSTPIMRDFLEKRGQFTAMPTAEGIAHFLAELEAAEPAPATVLFGDRERAAITAAIPGYLPFCENGDDGPPAPSLPYVDAVRRLSPTELIVTRSFDLARDGYLAMHLVDGYPTLPGTFVPELAAEAAVTLVPDRIPVVFEDLRLESFLRVYGPQRPQSKRMHAELCRHDEVESVVAVRVFGDVVSPGGTVLVEDKLHFSVRVRLRDTPTPSPRWDHWDENGSEPILDPYHVPDSPVLLREVFESTTDTRLHPVGRRGRLNLDAEAVRRWFPDLLVPSVLLDGLVRVGVLEKVSGRWIPVAVPRYIRRIDIYGRHTDLSLAESARPVQLYVTPVDLNLEDDPPDNRALAVAADGAVLLQVKDILGTIVGYVDRATGGYIDRRRFDREYASENRT